MGLALNKWGLDRIRRNLQDDYRVRGAWTAGERVKFDVLVNVALQRVNQLVKQGFKELPSEVELFGVAYITKSDPQPILLRGKRLQFRNADDLRFGSRVADAPPLPFMRLGYPLNVNHFITTADSAALLLFDSGDVGRVRHYQTGWILRLSPTICTYPLLEPIGRTCTRLTE